MVTEVGVEGDGFPRAIRPVTHTERKRRAFAGKCTEVRGGGVGGAARGVGGSSPSTASPGHIINIGKNSHLGTLTDEMTFR